jgi:hypothetical protein
VPGLTLYRKLGMPKINPAINWRPIILQYVFVLLMHFYNFKGPSGKPKSS